METEKLIPDNFYSIINDFAKDLSITYPEFTHMWSKWLNADISNADLKDLFDHCMKIYPERFFDILYQNNDIFNVDSEMNTFFLPDIDFKILYNCNGVSDNTKKTIWKYLQLILFTIVGNIKDKNNFGNTMNMFDGIDENDLQEKLRETIEGLTNFFTNIQESNETKGENETDGCQQGENQTHNIFENMFENMPNSEEFKKAFETMGGLGGAGAGNGPMPNIPNLDGIQDHLKKLFDGKIGSLAKEMAEEISQEFSDLIGKTDDIKSTNDVMKKLLKNPKKIMDLMKKVSGKLDDKMKNGDISKDEIMKEASDLISKMKDMGGVDQFNEVFKNLAKNMGGLGKNAKFDTNAVKRMANQNSMRDRLMKKMEEKKNKTINENILNTNINYSLQSTQQPNNFVFTLPDEGHQEKSLINNPEFLAQFQDDSKVINEMNNNKKKNKKKKAKK